MLKKKRALGVTDATVLIFVRTKGGLGSDNCFLFQRSNLNGWNPALNFPENSEQACEHAGRHKLMGV